MLRELKRPHGMLNKVLMFGIVVVLGALPDVWATETNLNDLIKNSRKLASQLMAQLQFTLIRELEQSGPIRSIVVCKFSGPETANGLSKQSGMRITRVTLKPRNPLTGEPDSWEQRQLLEFEKKGGLGEKGQELEASEIVTEPAGKYFRYMKAIYVKENCLVCHGPRESLSAAIRAQLEKEYPQDRAVDYKMGQIRGAVSIKQPLH